MMLSSHKRISHLYAQSTLSTLQAVMLFIAALFSTALLPSLVVRYFFAEQDLFAPPAVVEYIPLVSFAVSSLYFLYVIAANMRRSMLIQRLAKQAELESASCDDCQCGHHGHESDIDMSELKELEEMVDAALEAKPASRTKTAARNKKAKRAK